MSFDNTTLVQFGQKLIDPLLRQELVDQAGSSTNVILGSSELLIFAQPGAGKTYNAKGNWIDGDHLMAWPSKAGHFWYRHWTAAQQLLLGLGHLKTAVQVSRETCKAVAFCPNIDTLLVYGSRMLNVVVWIPPVEFIKSGLVERERTGRPGNPSLEESLNYREKLSQVAAYFGWTTVEGSYKDLVERLVLAKQTTIDHNVEVGTPFSLQATAVKSKLFVDHLRGSENLATCGWEDSFRSHYYALGFMKVCVCHGQPPLVDYDDELHYVEAVGLIVSACPSGLAIVGLADGTVLVNPWIVKSDIFTHNEGGRYMQEEGKIWALAHSTITLEICAIYEKAASSEPDVIGELFALRD